ncbi:hypothetical protein LXL04_010243 [Taraxacum kok-saghyz]
MTNIKCHLLWALMEPMDSTLMEPMQSTQRSVISSKICATCKSSIKSKVFLWLKCRGNGDICSWEEFCSSPFSSL